MIAPTLHLTNWSSTKLHGPGRKLTIMAKPRPWEHGEGKVPSMAPDRRWLDDLHHGEITPDAYRALCEERFKRSVKPPGKLLALRLGHVFAVADGDTLCCACSRAEAAEGRCHRVWASRFLFLAGWRVILDGMEVAP